jgi:hypothetical protein
MIPRLLTAPHRLEPCFSYLGQIPHTHKNSHDLVLKLPACQLEHLGEAASHVRGAHAEGVRIPIQLYSH